jgi:hypothetical protein
MSEAVLTTSAPAIASPRLDYHGPCKKVSSLQSFFV